MALELSIPALKATAPAIIKEASTFIKKKYDEYKILNNLSESNNELVSSIAKFMAVKTLLTGADNPVNLFDFFQQPELEFKKEKFCIEHIDEIKDKIDINTNNLIFKGTVGQGKSIFLRSLAIRDFVENKRIPIFIELKNISKNKSIVGLIKDYLSPWIGENDEIFKLVLKSGRVSIFLDAFDEIDLDLYQETYASIDTIITNYPELKLNITTRPETIILQNPNFYTISLCPYGIKQQRELIKKVVENSENQKFLIDSIRSSSFEVKSVLTTPLMVILYIKQYTYGFSIPKHVSDFYENIFDVVTFTHDKSKGIEKRKSFSNLNQDQLEKVFSRFCFESFLLKRTVFDKKLFIETLKKSLVKCSLSIDIDYTDLIYDYTRFACLILKDGLNYTFIHKSIQEYYVASFISNLPEALAKEVIEKKFIAKEIFFENDKNYMNFIKILKPYYYNKYYLIHILNEYKESIGLDFKKDKINFEKFLETLYIVKENGIENYVGIKYGNSYGFFDYFQDDIMEGFNYAHTHLNIDNLRMLLVNQTIIDNATISPKRVLEKVTDFTNDTKFFIDMRSTWYKICDEVDDIFEKVKIIETSVLDENFDF